MRQVLTRFETATVVVGCDTCEKWDMKFQVMILNGNPSVTNEEIYKKEADIFCHWSTGNHFTNERSRLRPKKLAVSSKFL
jgi:hypothetical protein